MIETLDEEIIDAAFECHGNESLSNSHDDFKKIRGNGSRQVVPFGVEKRENEIVPSVGHPLNRIKELNHGSNIKVLAELRL